MQRLRDVRQLGLTSLVFPGAEHSRFTHSIGAFSQGTFDLAFSVPWGLADGTYFIYTDMDYTGSIVEILEGDNTTVSAKKIRVNC